MSGDLALYTICGALIITVIVQTIGNVIVQRGLTRSIDTLSNKIMARDYRDYKSVEVKEDDVSPIKTDDEPLGWYDH